MTDGGVVSPSGSLNAGQFEVHDSKCEYRRHKNSETDAFVLTISVPEYIRTEL